jgi:hypothetical protein
MAYEVRNIKNFMGTDYPGYNATLYRDDKKVAVVINDGGGGEDRFHWCDVMEPRVEVMAVGPVGYSRPVRCTPEEALLLIHIRNKTLDMKDGSEPVPMSCGMFVASLIDAYENAKRIKRACRNKTLFRLTGDATEAWRVIKAPFSQHIKQNLTNLYGQRLETILNEQVGAS